MPADPEDLDRDPRCGDALAHDRIVGDTACTRGVDDLVEVATEAVVAGDGRRPALEAERRHRDLPAVAEAPDEVLGRAPRALEDHAVEARGAVGLCDRDHLDAGLVHREQQEGDRRVPRGVRIGAREQDHVVGGFRLAGPDLLAVDDELVTLEPGGGGERCEVGARLGLREALAPHDLPAQDAGQELLLLLLGAPRQERRADEDLAQRRHPHRGVRLREFLGEHDRLHRRQAASAVLARPLRADPAVLVHRPVPGFEELPPDSASRWKPSSNQPAGRCACSHARTSPRKSSTSGG